MSVFRCGRLDQSAQWGQRLARALLIVLLLCLTVSAQSSTFDPRHASHHEPGHCCLLCHLGSLPFVRTVAPAAVVPVFLTSWLAPSPEFQAFHEVLLSASSSRAPPAA